MNNEIKEIIDYISSRTVDDSLLEDYFTQLEDYITNLQEELKETADLCSKHFVKIQTLKEENEKLKNIIKEVREYIENHSITNIEWWITGKQNIECKFMKNTNPQELLEILDKESNNETI